MDLLATVRKEGSRGGAADFKWSDVQNSSRREHYLGHSLMAPVGRWAKARDPNWYAKADAQDGDDEDPAAKAARERKEEIRRVKEAEEDALAQALGLPVPLRNNANMEPVSDKRHTDNMSADSAALKDGGSKGLGYGKPVSGSHHVQDERIQDDAIAPTIRGVLPTIMNGIDDIIIDLTRVEIHTIGDIEILLVKDIAHTVPHHPVQPADSKVAESGHDHDHVHVHVHPPRTVRGKVIRSDTSQ